MTSTSSTQPNVAARQLFAQCLKPGGELGIVRTVDMSAEDLLLGVEVVGDPAEDRIELANELE